MAGTELAKAYVQIIPSAEGIKGKLTNVLGGEADSAGKSAGKSLGGSFVSSVKSIIAAAGIGMALKTALTEGADLQQSIGGIETLFKESADTVIANAKKAYTTAGMSANEYMETVTSFSASLLSSLGGDTQKAASAADVALQDMSDNANKMGTSMELIQNAYQGFAKQNYTMLDNLKLGYGGTKTEMERLLADAQKLTGVKYDINNLSDVYSAIHVIQDEMGITGSTAAEAAGTFSGSLSAMKAAAQNVLGNLALGEAIGPSLAALGDTFFTFVSGNLMPMLGNILTSLPEVVSSALGLLVQGLNAIDPAVITQMGISLVTGLAASIVSALPHLAEAAFNLIVGFGAALINADWAGIASGLISELSTNMSLASGEIFGSHTSIIDALLSSITLNLPSVLAKGSEILLNLIDGILSGIPNLIMSGGELINTFTGFLAQNMPAVLESGVVLLLSLVDGIIQNLPEIASSAISTIGKLVSTLLSNAPKLLETGITLLGKLAAGIISAVPDLISRLPGIISQIKSNFLSIDWGSVGKDIISGIARGITNCISDIVSAAKEAAQKALNAAKDFLGIKSPSRVFEKEVGAMIDKGLAAGIDNNISSVSASMKALSRETVGMIDTDLSYSILRLPEADTRYQQSEKIDYSTIQDIVRNELSSIVIKLNDREFGRAVRSVNT